jgi:hypothetical protein
LALPAGLAGSYPQIGHMTPLPWEPVGARLASMRRAKVGVAAGVLVVGLLAVLVGTAVWACTNLATLTLSSEAGRPGDTIILTGTSFPVRRADPNPTPVVVRWKSVDGPVLATVVPDRTGTIGTTFTVPSADPGPAVIVATQRRGLPDPDAPEAAPTQFIDEYGTPARVTFRVLAPGEVPVRSLPTSDFVVGASGDGGSTALFVLMLVFGAIALSLFGGGVIAFLHQMRSRRMVAQPQWIDEPPFREPPFRDW